MNQNQLDLIKTMCDEMVAPYKRMLTTKYYEDVINQDGGEFMPIVVSVLSSTLATCLASFANCVEDDPSEQNIAFKNMLTLVAIEASRGYSERNNKEALH